MATTTTPNVGITKATPGTNEPFSVTTVDANYDLIDAAIGKRSSPVGITTVANTVTETAIATHTLTGGTVASGNTFKIVAMGQGSVTGTPTLTFRLRLGGVAGVLIATIVVTASSGVTGKSWRAEGELICVSTGTLGTWIGGIQVVNDLASVLPSAADVNVAAAAVTKDSTVNQSLVITVQWSAASASNTLSTVALYGCREA